MSLSYREVAEIMKIIDASSLEEVVLEVDGAKLAVRRGDGSNRAPVTLTTSAGDVATRPEAKPASGGTAPASLKPPASTPTASEAVCSPMVGTFYRSPSPGEPSFVEIGSSVAVGDPLCLIEVMKLYTTIEATAAGTVEAILADDATLVEFDQPLFILRQE